MLLAEDTVRNGTHATTDIGMKISYADADDVVRGSSIGGKSIFANIAQGAAARFKLTMAVPKDFVPTKMLVTFAFDPKPFRVALPKASDTK